MRAFHENSNRIDTLNSHLLTLKRIITRMLLSSTKIFEASKPNSVDPDQTAPVSTMFASMLMLNKHFQLQLFCWRFKAK